MSILSKPHFHNVATAIAKLDSSKRQHLGTGGVGKDAVFSLVEPHGKVRSHRFPAVR